MVRFIALLSFASLLAADSSIPPSSTTGGFSEPNCTKCHTGTLNSPPGSVTFNPPVAYAPNSIVTIQVTISGVAGVRWGFELSARFTNGSQAGTLAASGPNTVVRTASWEGFPIQYALHSNPPVQAGSSFTFRVNWTAPPDTAGGDVVFNVVGMAADNDGTFLGDRTYSAEVRSLSSAPKVSAGGVVSAASFVPAPGNLLAPGQLISIFGSGMTAGGPYRSTTIPLPTTLGPTTVRISSMDIPLVYVSSSQINAQVPFGVVEGGSRSLVVLLVDVLASAPEMIPMVSTAPGIFTTAQNGTGNAAALHSDFTPVDAVKPAHAGEIVLFFCTGLGVTVNGVIAVAPVTMTIGGQPAPVSFAGLAPGFVGLNQINAVMPAVSGNAEVRVTAGAATSRSGVTIPVQ